MVKQSAMLAALLLSAGAQAAEGGGGFLDIYFVPSAKFEISDPTGSVDDSGTGFGIKGMGRGSNSIAFTGEYQNTSFDDFDADVSQLRFGLGIVGATNSGVFLEYISLDIEDYDASGFGLHGRLAGENLYGQIGYVSIEDDFENNTGIELAFGAAFDFSGNTGGFIDLRRTAVEGEDSNIELEFTDIRAGIRFKF